MSSFSTKLLSCIVLVIALSCGTFGRLNTHVGVLVGKSTTLYCHYACSFLSWWLNSELIVDSGQLVEAHNYRKRFNFSCSQEIPDYDQPGLSGWNELTLLSTQIEDSGHYVCGDNRSSTVALVSYYRVTVILSEPVGQVVPKYLLGGDNVTISCSVGYFGPETPYIQWTDENDEVVNGTTEWTDTDNDTNPEYNVTSDISVFVPDDAEYLSPYTCSVRFYSYHQRPHNQLTYYNQFNIGYYNNYDTVYTPYNWTSPETKVSYCPRNVWLRGQHEHFAVKSSLSCVSDAHPTAQYRWNIIKGSGFADGQFFVVDSPGFFNISCTAYNFLRPPDDECTAATVYTTGYVPSDDESVLVIVLDVLLAISVIVNIVIIVLIIICARKHDIPLRDVIGRSTVDGGKHKQNDCIERPDTVTVITAPNRQNTEPVHEATGDQDVHADTDTDARTYEGLRRSDLAAGQQPVYQPLVKDEAVCEEADTGAGKIYEGLRLSDVGQQPIYQRLAKGRNSAPHT